jgi:peptidoglycan/LPS O-acetylase OafA/YrhL
MKTAAADYSWNINGFRGICVLLVFLHHVANSGLPPPPDSGSLVQTLWHQLFMSFGYGVELFFMISGYVIVNSLSRHASLASFLLDRVIRIFPVWVPIAVFLCIARWVAGDAGGASPAKWLLQSLANLFLLPPLLPLPLLHPASWSLTYEWVFYIASAAAALLWRRSAPAANKWLWAFVAAALIACYPRALFFLPGVLIALAPQKVRWLQRTPALAPIMLLVFLFSWYETGVFAAEFKLPLWDVLLAGKGLAVLVAVLAATHVIASVALPGSPRGLGLLRTRALQHLGTISYSFYLVHPVVMSLVKRGLLKLAPSLGSWEITFAFALLAGLLSWVVAYWSWRLLEQGVAKWFKRRLRARSDRAPFADVPASRQA